VSTQTSAATGLPLAGISVVAWEQAVSAPLASRHLADLGAAVTKVEKPGGGDFGRVANSFVRGLSSYFVWCNRGKRSVVLDLKTDTGRIAFDRLLASADVLIHNQGPGVAERLGYGYARLSRRHPALVYCAISGYGPDGPYRDRRAYDALIQGESGLVAMTGTPDTPSKAGASIADISTGMYAFGSILAALYRRRDTGKGAEINISMLESLTEWIGPQALSTRYTGRRPGRVGNHHPAMVPQGGYRCGDGQIINLAVQNDRQWERLCTLILRRPEWVSDERFRTNQDRVQHRDVLEPMLEEALAGRGRDDIERELEQARLPYGSVNEVDQVLAHPQLAWRDRWFDVPSPKGPLRVLHHPFNIEGLPRPAGAIPDYGEHTEEVLGELGLAPEPGSAERAAGR
jgi:itaconate CoA-transferase